MRLISKYTKGIYLAEIRYNSLLEEYIVKFYINGLPIVDADYFTDDKADAVGTAEVQINKLFKEKDHV